MRDVLKAYLEDYTDVDDAALEEVLNEIPIGSFKKGTVLIEQGIIPDKCYFVLKGCVRQYAINDEGTETTFNFYTELEAAAVFNIDNLQTPSKYSLVCMEDCVLLIGDLNGEQDMYDKYPFLNDMTRKMMEEMMAAMQDHYSNYVASSPEERYLYIKNSRPELLTRVPQHQLASFLGIKPESLSRIKRRVEQSHLKAVE